MTAVAGIFIQLPPMPRGMDLVCAVPESKPKTFRHRSGHSRLSLRLLRPLLPLFEWLVLKVGVLAFRARLCWVAS
jgi:hypothetical protein